MEVEVRGWLTIRSSESDSGGPLKVRRGRHMHMYMW